MVAPCAPQIQDTEETEDLAEPEPAAEDNPEPQNRKEFLAWKAQFKNNLFVAAELYRDRPASCAV